MPKPKASQPIERRCVVLFTGDWEKIMSLFPDKGASFVIREVVHDFLKRVENRAPKSELEIELKDIDL